MSTTFSSSATFAALDDDLLARARRAVVARSVYLAVSASWVVVSIGLVAIWYLTTPEGYFWPIWPVLNFALASTVWGLAVYRIPPFRVSDDKVRLEAERLRSRETLA